jgi:hypothetical protein
MTIQQLIEFLSLIEDKSKVVKTFDHDHENPNPIRVVEGVDTESFNFSIFLDLE